MSEFEEIPVEPDRISSRVINYVLASTIVVIAICACAILLVLGGARGGGRSAVVEIRELPPPASPFAGPTPLELEQRARTVGLDSWQWADRAHGTVLVPVDIAIDRYVDERSKR
ncbi:MAG TPA: hypothetical protein VGF94_15395 [Kofleriaceae bacterium]